MMGMMTDLELVVVLAKVLVILSYKLGLVLVPLLVPLVLKLVVMKEY